MLAPRGHVSTIQLDTRQPGEKQTSCHPSEQGTVQGAKRRRNSGDRAALGITADQQRYLKASLGGGTGLRRPLRLRLPKRCPLRLDLALRLGGCRRAWGGLGFLRRLQWRTMRSRPFWVYICDVFSGVRQGYDMQRLCPASGSCIE
jgi:hypothetical protein